MVPLAGQRLVDRNVARAKLKALSRRALIVKLCVVLPLLPGLVKVDPQGTRILLGGSCGRGRPGGSKAASSERAAESTKKIGFLFV